MPFFISKKSKPPFRIIKRTLANSEVWYVVQDWSITLGYYSDVFKTRQKLDAQMRYDELMGDKIISEEVIV